MNNMLSALGNILEEKGDNLNNNELFGIISLVTLNKILELYQLNKGDNLSGGQVSNLLEGFNKQQGNDLINNNNLQKMLPMLMQLLGEGNNMNSIMNLLTKSKKTPEEQPQKIEEEPQSKDFKKKS